MARANSLLAETSTLPKVLPTVRRVSNGERTDDTPRSQLCWGPTNGGERAHCPTAFSIPSHLTAGCVMRDIADLECENLSNS